MYVLYFKTFKMSILLKWSSTNAHASVLFDSYMVKFGVLYLLLFVFQNFHLRVELIGTFFSGLCAAGIGPSVYSTFEFPESSWILLFIFSEV